MGWEHPHQGLDQSLSQGLDQCPDQGMSRAL